MDELIKKAIFILGIIAALYILVVFVLPFLWSLAVFLVKMILYAALILTVLAALGYGVVFLVRFIER